MRTILATLCLILVSCTELFAQNQEAAKLKLIGTVTSVSSSHDWGKSDLRDVRYSIALYMHFRNDGDKAVIVFQPDASVISRTATVEFLSNASMGANNESVVKRNQWGETLRRRSGGMDGEKDRC